MCNGNRINSSSFPEVKDDRIELDVNTDVDTESMLWLGIAASNSLTRKTTRLESGTCNLTSSTLHRHKIMKNVMVANIRVPRLMRPCRVFFT